MVGMDKLTTQYTCVAPWLDAHPSSEDISRAAAKYAPDIEALIVRLWPVDAGVIERLPRLRVIVKHGAGVDNIDCRSAADRGITVAYTPRSVTRAVVEHTLALLLALARRIPAADQSVRSLEAIDRSAFMGVELEGKTLGVIGYGRVGREVARIASCGLAMRVLAYDPFAGSADSEDVEVANSLDAVLERADFLTFHVPFTPENRHMLNSERITRLKAGVRVINTSRGGVIDEFALAEALTTGSVAGAALDVFESEPLPDEHPLRVAPNLIMTPHIASSTEEAMARTSSEAADAVIEALAGRTPRDIVSPS
jgi:D-3-phosphoglycerate dehydrogenase